MEAFIFRGRNFKLTTTLLNLPEYTSLGTFNAARVSPRIHRQVDVLLKFLTGSIGQLTHLIHNLLKLREPLWSHARTESELPPS
jgi:hypothetical protein